MKLTELQKDKLLFLEIERALKAAQVLEQKLFGFEDSHTAHVLEKVMKKRNELTFKE